MMTDIFVLIVQSVGIIVPLMGIIALLVKEQNKAASFLTLSNIGCLIINSSYLLLLQSKGFDEAMLALKMEYLGNTLFYFFFVVFVISFLRLRYPKWIFPLWAVFEVVILALIWNDNFQNLVFEHLEFASFEKTNFHYMKIETGNLYSVRYGMLSVALLGILIYTTLRMFRTQVLSERYNLARLAGAQAIIIVSLSLTMLFQFPFNIVPICSSFAVIMIILSVIKGEFFRVTDRGRTWVFEHMEDVFLIVDNMYGYLDANNYAKAIFPKLPEKIKNQRIPEEVYQLFVSEEAEFELEGKYYKKEVTVLEQKGEAEGYCLILQDVTEQHQLVEELKVEKERAEEANRAKSAFMSNMSHEIRTPMNAIVGMTEILLRGQLPRQEQGYLLNIKNSGDALLAIINDILDFSKIESGRLEIIEDEYEPMSMLSDLSMIFLNRIGEKKIELLFDIDEELPMILYGDSLRLRQVIINIMNNAIKFTEEGYVKLLMKINRIQGEEMELYVSVKDTGQGIRKEDIEKLFGAFQQVDTKKNRNKEGTGLGLSISKRLVELMGGTIEVHSVYGEGSEFTFTVKQKIRDGKRAAQIKNLNKEEPLPVISGRMKEPYLLEELKKLAEAYGLSFVEYEAGQEQKIHYLFTDSEAFIPASNLTDSREDMTVCLLQNPMLENICVSGVTVVNKPLYSLNFCQILNHEIQDTFMEREDYLNFTAPDAEVLIVDDNEMNRKVALGLLQPLQMQIDTAENGKEALKKIQKKQYHLIFMDHMMPVMDGIEATQKLRQLEVDYYKQVPVIALTANAVVSAKESFLEAGMNDFVAKPIEMKEICTKIKHWLPKELLQKPSIQKIQEKQPESLEDIPEIEGIDIAEGIHNSGTKELFVSLLGDFYKLIDLKSTKIEKCLADGLLHDYTIEVHALKNTARMIGAMELSQRFCRMEELGNEKNREVLERETPAVLELYRSYKPILKQFGEAEQQGKEKATGKELISILKNLESAMDSFDLDGADEALKKLENYQMPGECQMQMEALRAYVADVAMEEVIGLTKTMTEVIKAIPKI